MIPSFRFSLNKSFLAAAALSLAAGAAQAATFTWQTPATTTNTWTTATGNTNWFIDAGVAASNWANGNAAVFNAATGETITLTGTLTPTSVDIGTNNGNWTFSGAGLIGGTGGVTKNGTGTVTLNNTAANTYSGGTVINGGTLALGTGNGTGNAAAFGTGSILVNAGGTLKLWLSNSAATTYLNAITLNGGKILGEDGVNTIGAVTLGASGGTLSAKWSSKNLVAGGAITGTGSLIADSVSGTTVILAANNSYTGTTTLNSGILQVGNGGTTGSFGTGAVQINGGRLLFNRTDAPVFNNNISFNQGGTWSYVEVATGTSAALSGVISSGGASGTGVLWKNGAGTLILSGSNTYSGGTEVHGGTLRVSSLANLSTGYLAVKNGATLQYDGAGAETLSRTIWMDTGDWGVNVSQASGSLTLSPTFGNQNKRLVKSGAGTLVYTGNLFSANGAVLVNAGTLTLSGANTYTGTTTVSAGTLNLTGSLGAGTYAGNISLGSGAAFNVDSTGAQTLSGVISGAGGVSKANSGTLTLTGANTFTGGLTVNAGVVSLGAANATGTGLLTIAAPATVRANNNAFTVSGLAGSGTLALGTAVATVTVADNVTSTFAGTITGGTLAKAGAGTQILTGANAMTSTSVTAGTLRVNTGATLGAGAIANNATLQYDRTDTLTVANAITGTGSILKTGTGALTLSNNANTQSGVAVSGGSVTLAGGVYAGASSVNGAGTALNLDYGNGTQRFSAGSTLALGAGVAGSRSALTLTGGAVADSVASTTLRGDVVITRTSGTSTLDLGLLRGAGVIVVGTNGVLRTTSANNASGFIDAGILVTTTDGVTTVTTFAANDGFGNLGGLAGTVGVERGGGAIGATATDKALAVNNNGPGDGTGVITLGALGAGNIKDINVLLVVTDAGLGGGATRIDLGDRNTLRLSAAGGITQVATVAGALTLNGGSLTAGGPANNAGTLAFTNFSEAHAIVIGSAVVNNGTGVVSLTKDGAGRLVLSGNNTYTGTTAVNGGTLVLTGTNASTSALTIAAGATLRVGDNTAGGSIGGDGSSILRNDGALVFANTGGTTLARAVTGSGSLSVETGTLTLTGANNYLGSTTIGSGATLRVGAGAATGTLGQNVALTNNGTLVYDRADNVSIVAPVISGSGALEKNGPGTLVLSSSNTYAGKTTINGGVVSIASDSALGAAPGTFVADQLRLDGGRLVITANTQTLNANRGITLGANGGAIDNSRLTGSGITTTINGLITGTGPLTLAGNGNLAANGGGDGGFGIYLANANNNFVGDITITAGLVTFNGNGALGNAANNIILNGGGLLSTGSVTISRNIESRTGGVIRAWGGATITLTGAITGTGTITKTDSGLVTIRSNSTVIGANWNIGGGEIAVQTEGGLTQTLSGNLSGNGAFSKRGAGKLILGGVNSAFSGGIEIIGGGILEINSTAALGTGYVTVRDNSTLRYAGAGSETFVGSIWMDRGALAVDVANAGATFTMEATSGVRNQSLTKKGLGTFVLGGVLANAAAPTTVTVEAGTLVLTKANTYGGATLVSGGTLQVGDGISTTASLGSAADVSLATGGTLALNLVGVNNAAVVFSKNIIDSVAGQSGALNKLGVASTVVLTGNNTYTGLTTVSEGTLRLGSANAHDGAGAIALTANSVFDANGNNFTARSAVAASGALTGLGELSLSNAAVATIDQTAEVSTFAGTITGTGSLLKTGAGTLVLTGAGNYTGATTVNGGTLQLGSGGATGKIDGTSSIILGSAGVLAFNRRGNVDFNQSITGTGGVTQRGPASSIITLRGNNTYTGLTHVVTGTLKLGSAAAFGGQGAIEVDDGATFDIGANAITLNTSALSGAGRLNAGFGGNLTVASTVDSVFEGKIAGFGNFTKTGTADFTLTGTSNDFTGTLTVSAGELILGGDSGTISNNRALVTVNAPGALVFAHTGVGTTTFDARVTGAAGTIIQRGTGASTLTGLVSGGISVTNEGGTAGALTLTDATNLGVVTNAGTTTIGSSAASRLADTATIASITNTAGTLRVSSNVTGALTVSGGTVIIGAGQADTYAKLTGNETKVENGGTLVFDRAGSYAVSGVTASGTGVIEQAGSTDSVITLAGANTLTSTNVVKVTSGTLAITDATNAGLAKLLLNGGHLQVGLVGGSAVNLADNDVEAKAGTLSSVTGLSNVDFSKAFVGTGAIRYRGDGVLNGGAGAANEATFTAGGGQIIRDGGELNIKGVDFTATNFDDNIGVTNGTALLSAAGPANFIVQQNQDGTASGVLSDGNTQILGLVKNGAGTLTLTGTNTYSGTTTVNDGVLRVGDGTAPGDTGKLGTGLVTVNAVGSTAGTLSFAHTDAITVGVGAFTPGQTGALALTNTGTLSNSGSGVLTLTTAAPATLTVGNLTGSGAIVLDAGLTLNVDTDSTTGAVKAGDTYSGVLSGSADSVLVKSGAGTFVLSGNSTLTTITQVTGGTLQLGNGGTSGMVGGDATGLVGTQDIVLSGGVNTMLAVDRSGKVTLAGKVTGSGSLSVIGSTTAATAASPRTLVLTNRNTYLGQTVIRENATIQVGDGTVAGNAGKLGGGGVQNMGKLSFNRTDDVVLTNAITGTGSVEQRGPGKLTLSGSTLYSGETRATAGSIQVNTASLPTGAFFADTVGTIIFNGTGASTVQNGIGGAGHVEFQGAGGVTTLKSGISGDSSGLAGVMDIESGHTLKLATGNTSVGTSASQMNVLLGGRLSGIGTIGGNLKNFGTIAPGNSPGILNVAGDFTTLGTLNMEIAGAGAAGAADGHDLINYGGTATLGGTLNVTFTNGFAPLPGFKALLLRKVDAFGNAVTTPGGSIVGNFVNLPANGRIITTPDSVMFFNGSSLGQLNGVQLHDGVATFADAFSPAGTTAVHPQFANFLALGTASGAVTQAQADAALATALQNASPIGLAALTALPTQQAVRDADDVRRRAEMQTLAATTPFGDATDWLAYVAGSGAMLDADSDASSPSFDTRSYGGLVGLERRIGDGATAIGFRFGYDRGTATLHDNGGKIDQDHARGTLYAITQLGENGYLSGGVGMGYSSSDTTRNTLGGTTQKASPTGWDVSASVDGGYIFRLNREWSLTPHAGVSVTQAQVAGFTESGSDLALAVDGYAQTSATTRIGTGLYREWLAKNFTRNALRIGVDVSYEHALFGDTVEIPASFAQVPQAGSFKSESPALIKDSLVVGPQIQWVFDETRSISAGYRFQMGFDGSTGQRADISFEQRF